jgi:hypothetical protein
MEKPAMQKKKPEAMENGGRLINQLDKSMVK